MKKDETAYLAPDNTIFNAASRDSLESSSLNAHLPFHNTRLRDFNLLDHLLHVGHCHLIRVEYCKLLTQEGFPGRGLV